MTTSPAVNTSLKEVNPYSKEVDEVLYKIVLNKHDSQDKLLTVFNKVELHNFENNELTNLNKKIKKYDTYGGLILLDMIISILAMCTLGEVYAYAPLICFGNTLLSFAFLIAAFKQSNKIAEKMRINIAATFNKLQENEDQFGPYQQAADVSLITNEGDKHE